MVVHDLVEMSDRCQDMCIQNIQSECYVSFDCAFYANLCVIDVEIERAIQAVIKTRLIYFPIRYDQLLRRYEWKIVLGFYDVQAQPNTSI